MSRENNGGDPVTRRILRLTNLMWDSFCYFGHVPPRQGDQIENIDA